jgi:hypothetical protein
MQTNQSSVDSYSKISVEKQRLEPLLSHRVKVAGMQEQDFTVKQVALGVLKELKSNRFLTKFSPKIYLTGSSLTNAVLDNPLYIQCNDIDLKIVVEDPEMGENQALIFNGVRNVVRKVLGLSQKDVILSSTYFAPDQYRGEYTLLDGGTGLNKNLDISLCVVQPGTKVHAMNLDSLFVDLQSFEEKPGEFELGTAKAGEYFLSSAEGDVEIIKAQIKDKVITVTDPHKAKPRAWFRYLMAITEGCRDPLTVNNQEFYKIESLAGKDLVSNLKKFLSKKRSLYAGSRMPGSYLPATFANAMHHIIKCSLNLENTADVKSSSPALFAEQNEVESFQGELFASSESPLSLQSESCVSPAKFQGSVKNTSPTLSNDLTILEKLAELVRNSLSALLLRSCRLESVPTLGKLLSPLLASEVRVLTHLGEQQFQCGFKQPDGTMLYQMVPFIEEKDAMFFEELVSVLNIKEILKSIEASSAVVNEESLSCVQTEPFLKVLSSYKDLKELWSFKFPHLFVDKQNHQTEIKVNEPDAENSSPVKELFSLQRYLSGLLSVEEMKEIPPEFSVEKLSEKERESLIANLPSWISRLFDNSSEEDGLPLSSFINQLISLAPESKRAKTAGSVLRSVASTLEDRKSSFSPALWKDLETLYSWIEGKRGLSAYFLFLWTNALFSGACSKEKWLHCYEASKPEHRAPWMNVLARVARKHSESTFIKFAKLVLPLFADRLTICSFGGFKCHFDHPEENLPIFIPFFTEDDFSSAPLFESKELSFFSDLKLSSIEVKDETSPNLHLDLLKEKSQALSLAWALKFSLSNSSLLETEGKKNVIECDPKAPDWLIKQACIQYGFEKEVSEKITKSFEEKRPALAKTQAVFSDRLSLKEMKEFLLVADPGVLSEKDREVLVSRISKFVETFLKEPLESFEKGFELVPFLKKLLSSLKKRDQSTILLQVLEEFFKRYSAEMQQFPKALWDGFNELFEEAASLKADPEPWQEFVLGKMFSEDLMTQESLAFCKKIFLYARPQSSNRFTSLEISMKAFELFGLEENLKEALDLDHEKAIETLRSLPGFEENFEKLLKKAEISKGSIWVESEEKISKVKKPERYLCRMDKASKEEQKKLTLGYLSCFAKNTPRENRLELCKIYSTCSTEIILEEIEQKFLSKPVSLAFFTNNPEAKAQIQETLFARILEMIEGAKWEDVYSLALHLDKPYLYETLKSILEHTSDDPTQRQTTFTYFKEHFPKYLPALLKESFKKKESLAPYEFFKFIGEHHPESIDETCREKLFFLCASQIHWCLAHKKSHESLIFTPLAECLFLATLANSLETQSTSALLEGSSLIKDEDKWQLLETLAALPYSEDVREVFHVVASSISASDWKNQKLLYKWLSFRMEMGEMTQEEMEGFLKKIKEFPLFSGLLKTMLKQEPKISQKLTFYVLGHLLPLVGEKGPDLQRESLQQILIMLDFLLEKAMTKWLLEDPHVYLSFLTLTCKILKKENAALLTRNRQFESVLARLEQVFQQPLITGEKNKHFKNMEISQECIDVAFNHALMMYLTEIQQNPKCRQKVDSLIKMHFEKTRDLSCIQQVVTMCEESAETAIVLLEELTDSFKPDLDLFRLLEEFEKYEIRLQDKAMIHVSNLFKKEEEKDAQREDSLAFPATLCEGLKQAIQFSETIKDADETLFSGSLVVDVKARREFFAQCKAVQEKTESTQRLSWLDPIRDREDALTNLHIFLSTVEKASLTEKHAKRLTPVLEKIAIYLQTIKKLQALFWEDCGSLSACSSKLMNLCLKVKNLSLPVELTRSIHVPGILSQQLSHWEWDIEAYCTYLEKVFPFVGLKASEIPFITTHLWIYTINSLVRVYSQERCEKILLRIFEPHIRAISHDKNDHHVPNAALLSLYLLLFGDINPTYSTLSIASDSPENWECTKRLVCKAFESFSGSPKNISIFLTCFEHLLAKLGKAKVVENADLERVVPGDDGKRVVQGEDGRVFLSEKTVKMIFEQLAVDVNNYYSKFGKETKDIFKKTISLFYKNCNLYVKDSLDFISPGYANLTFLKAVDLDGSCGIFNLEPSLSLEILRSLASGREEVSEIFLEDLVQNLKNSLCTLKDIRIKKTAGTSDAKSFLEDLINLLSLWIRSHSSNIGKQTKEAVLESWKKLFEIDGELLVHILAHVRVGEEQIEWLKEFAAYLSGFEEDKKDKKWEMVYGHVVVLTVLPSETIYRVGFREGDEKRLLGSFVMPKKIKKEPAISSNATEAEIERGVFRAEFKG